MSTPPGPESTSAGTLTAAPGPAGELAGPASAPPGPRSPLLELDGVDVTYQRRGRPPVRAVIGADLQVAAGEIVGLVGESGCGKSTLGRAAVGLVAPAAGRVRYDGAAVPPLGRRARPPWLRSLQMVFQDPYASLNPRRRVGRQIADAIALGTGRPRPDGTDAPEITAALERVGLTRQVASRFPHEFSGGQCQRIAIARVLASEPRCIVADEPISSLDASAQAQVANLLAGAASESGLGLLFVSHDLSVVRKVASRTVVMYLGRIVEQGPTDLVWSRPAHPYTASLIEAIPVPGAGRALPAEVRGDVPDPARPPEGCRFHPRCPLAVDRCRAEEPPEQPVGSGRSARCWRSEEMLAGPPAAMAPEPAASTLPGG